VDRFVYTASSHLSASLVASAVFALEAQGLRISSISLLSPLVVDMAAIMEMKVSMKKPANFYIRSAQSFLKGVDARPAADGKDAVEAKPPVEELKISGLGEAIGVAVTAAARSEADGFATITKVETEYPEMSGGHGCAQILITLKRKH